MKRYFHGIPGVAAAVAMMSLEGCNSDPTSCISTEPEDAYLGALPKADYEQGATTTLVNACDHPASGVMADPSGVNVRIKQCVGEFCSFLLQPHEQIPIRVGLDFSESKPGPFEGSCTFKDRDAEHGFIFKFRGSVCEDGRCQ